MQKIIYFILGLLLGGNYLIDAQILRFGSKLDGTGNLVMVDTIFKLETTPQVVYAKLFSKTPIIEDTLFIIAKNLHTSNKFVLKRSTNKMDALATLKFKEDGIYKVFVVNPKTKQTIASKKIYITSAVNPNVQALKADYQKQLALQNQTKPNPNPNNPKPNNTTISTNVTKPNPQNITHKPSTSTKDDFDDLEEEEDIGSDADMDEGNIDAEIDLKNDDLSDFDDAD